MIEKVSNQNLYEILPLIRQYQEFYSITGVSESRNRAFFSSIAATNSQGKQFLYRENNVVIGFATVYFSFSSTIAAKVAILNDLFVLPKCRGKGIGKALINHCQEFAIVNKFERLQWMTAHGNQEAQALYDSLNATKSLWYLYYL